MCIACNIIYIIINAQVHNNNKTIMIVAWIEFFWRSQVTAFCSELGEGWLDTIAKVILNFQIDSRNTLKLNQFFFSVLQTESLFQI